MSERGTGRESDKFMLRFPDGMRDEIRRRAEQNKRSMNAEIIARLEATLSPQPTAFTETEIKRATEFLRFITSTMMSDREVKSALIESLLEERAKGDADSSPNENAATKADDE